MQQDRAAFEDRKPVIGKPRHLAEGLMGEMRRLAVLEGRAFDFIRQARLLQRPADADIAHKPARHFGNPIEGGENQTRHAASPFC